MTHHQTTRHTLASGIATAVVCVAMTLASCSVYHPQSVDIPLLEEAGETRVDAALGVSSYAVIIPTNVNVNLTASHAFGDRLAGQVHANFGDGDYYLQAAPGLFWASEGSTRLEVYAGMGYGGLNSESHPLHPDDDTPDRVKYDGNYLLPFAQFNFGWRHVGPFEFGFGIKAGAFIPKIDRTEYTTDYSSADGSNEVASSIRLTNTDFLFEPQMHLRIGGDHVMYTVRLGFCLMNNFDNHNSHFSYSQMTFSNGLVFSF